MESSCRTYPKYSLEPRFYDGKQTAKNFQVGGNIITTDTGIQYSNFGMLVSDPNKTLRVPQRRAFDGPIFFNGHCLGLTCQSQKHCPLSSGSTIITSDNQNMDKSIFDPIFQSYDMFVTSNDPTACKSIKNNNYSSMSGWNLDNNNQFEWQKQNNTVNVKQC